MNQKLETDPKFLELLVCPIDKTSLEYDSKNQILVSKGRHLSFMIRDGVPILTIDSAKSTKSA